MMYYVLIWRRWSKNWSCHDIFAWQSITYKKLFEQISWLFMLVLAISVIHPFNLHWGWENPVLLSCCSAPPNPLDPLCVDDQGAAAPVDEEPLRVAPVLRLHADVWQHRWFQLCSPARVTCWIFYHFELIPFDWRLKTN